MVSKNKCRLCGRPLPPGTEKVDIYFCGECSSLAAVLLSRYIVELLRPDSNDEYEVYIELFLQAAAMLHYLPEWCIPICAEKGASAETPRYNSRRKANKTGGKVIISQIGA